MITTPSKYFLVSGSAEGSLSLNAFDHALINSGIGNLNLVKISSILPPKAQHIKQIQLPSGSLTSVAYASIISKNVGEVITAAVACAVPKDNSQPGLIMEHSSHESKEATQKTIFNMLEEGMAYRKIAIQKIHCTVVSHTVVHIGAAFAGVVLC